MLIVHVTTTDPAGAVYNMIRAVNEHTPHRARLITTQAIPGFDFPRDIMDLFDRGDEAEALLRHADVIHFHKINEDFTIEFPLANGVRTLPLSDFIAGKKIVHHIHGAPFERNFVKETAEDYARRGRHVLCSTPDLEAMYKPFYANVRYFPNCIPINDVRYLPRASDDPITSDDGVTKKYCVFQSGTHSILKNMHVIRGVMDKLALELPVFFLHTTPDNIQSQDFTLRHKRIAHIVFDHIEGYYGLSSLEALSMAKPTIAGLNKNTIEAICNFFGIGEAPLPWCIAYDAAGIEQWIRALMGSAELRRHHGSRGRQFMETVWSDKALAQRMVSFYESI